MNACVHTHADYIAQRLHLKCPSENGKSFLCLCVYVVVICKLWGMNYYFKSNLSRPPSDITILFIYNVHIKSIADNCRRMYYAYTDRLIHKYPQMGKIRKKIDVK